MEPQRRIAWLATLLTIVLAVSLASCGNKATGPAGGGGGTAKELDSGNIANGGVFQHTFANAGTFEYFCTIHGAASMSGTVTVAAGQPMNAAVTIANFSYSPANAMVAPGGTVTWTNNGSTHTVTSK